MNISPSITAESLHYKEEEAPLISPILAHTTCFFRFTFYLFQTYCWFLEKIFSIFNLTNSLRIPSQLVYFLQGASRVRKPDLNITSS